MKEETGVQRKILVSVAGKSTLFRNNCGQYKVESGAIIRYGIANPGGSDLIGWTPKTITLEMVGKTVAVFTAIEVKTPGWTNPTRHRVHGYNQGQRFLQYVAFQ